MEVLIKYNTTSVEVPIKVTSPSSLYTLTYTEVDTTDQDTVTGTVGSGSIVTFTLDPSYLKYTGRFHGVVTDDSDAQVASLGINIIRPYCDIDSVAAALSMTADAAVQAEKVARSIIDAEVGRLSYQRKNISAIGMGMDYLPVPEPIHNIYEILMNGEMIHDSSDPDNSPYGISIDRSSIILLEDENRLEYSPVWRTRYAGVDFPSGYDYTILGDFGYPYIPEDITEACELLIQDIATGNMRFTNRGISEFDNKEFRIKYATGTETGTGNKTVDKILDGYRNRIVPGVI